MALVIFERDPIGVDGALEANGTVRFFCSEMCRSSFDVFPTDVDGESDDFVEGTVCENCGKPLESAR